MSSQLRSLARQAASWATKFTSFSQPVARAAARGVSCELAAAAEAASAVRSCSSSTLAFRPSQTLNRQLCPILGRYHGIADRSKLRSLSTEAAETENKEKQGEPEQTEATAGEEEVDAGEEGSPETEDERYNELLEQVKAKDAEVADFKDRALRALAELENVRERTKR